MYAIFKSFWVRKLIGEPAFLTIADCESEARRIQNSILSHAAVFSPFATKSNAFRNYGVSALISTVRAMIVTLRHNIS